MFNIKPVLAAVNYVLTASLSLVWQHLCLFRQHLLNLLQVEYLFCDKTGTLTENCMEFRQCSINGRLYIEEGGSFIRNHPLEAELEAEKAARKVKSTDSAANTRDSVGLRLSVDAAGLADSLEMDQSKMTKETQLDEVDGVCGTIPFFSPLFFSFYWLNLLSAISLLSVFFFYFFSFCIL